MLCESCKDKEATIHLTQVVEGAVRKLHLCEDCAAKSGFDIHGPMSITDMLLGMGGEAPAVPAPAEPKAKERSCPRCHMRRTDFKKTSRFGCPACYETFAEDLPPLLKAIHRSERHTGKVPGGEGAKLRATAEIADLQKELDEAIAAERFEEAARIRDELQQRRAQLLGRKAKSSDP